MESICIADTWSRKHSTTANGFCSYKVPVGVSQPRAIVTRRSPRQQDAGSNNSAVLWLDEALVLERGTQSILYLQWNMSRPLLEDDDDGTGTGAMITATRLLTKIGLNHGLAWTSSHIYASTATTVYRWPILRRQDEDDEPDGTNQQLLLMTVDVGSMETVVVENIPADGRGGAPQGHTTRTLAIDENEEYLYVSVGSYANIDENSDRSRIRRFNLKPLPQSDEDDNNQTFPWDFTRDGQIFADGLRNEVALDFDANGILWGIGNSGDDLFRADLGGDIHNDNPAEEVHRLGLNQHYGYPFCWREYQLGKMGLGQGTAWAWPTTMGNVTDQDCRERDDAPIATLPAHSAPLGLTFYRYQNETTCPGVIPFPAELDGFAFIAYHGSWNRDIPTGYKVVYVDLSQANGNAVPPTDLLSSAGCYAKWDDGTRPVDLTFDQCGRLWVTSDGSSRGRGSHLIIIESTSTVLLPQPPTEIPCAWRLPAWAIGLTVVIGGGGLILMVGLIWFMKRWKNNFTRLTQQNVN